MVMSKATNGRNYPSVRQGLSLSVVGKRRLLYAHYKGQFVIAGQPVHNFRFVE